MNILFVGSKDRGVACLRKLVARNKEVVGVVTQSQDDPDGFWDESVSETAADLDIPRYSPENINDPDFVSVVTDLPIDLIVLCGYNQILGPEILDYPTDGVINLHAGRLPDYRGGSPMNWAIINGEKTVTATIHYATERVDAGSVLAEKSRKIDDTDTIEDLRQWTLNIYPELLISVIDDIGTGRETVKSIDVSDGTYWGSRKPQDGRIHWDRMTARDVHNRVRALTDPYPGAFTSHNGTKLYIWKTELLEDTVKHEPGRVCMARNGGRVVMAADRGIVLKTVQPEQKERQSGATYLHNGEYLE